MTALQMDISCVILSWNSEKYLAKCLDPLLLDLEQHQLSHEIFVVDNGSKDRSVSILESMKARYPDRVFPLYLDHNTGTTYSRNQALKQSRGRYICVLDSDVEVARGAIVQLIRTLETDGHIGLVAPKLVYANASLQKSVDQFPTVFLKAQRYFFLKSMEKRDNAITQSTMCPRGIISEVDYAISAMWVFRRVVLEQVGFLDEKIFYAPEDVDYCLRIWNAGFTVVYDPSVTCVHHTQEISRGPLSRATMQHILGLCYFFKKHRYLFVRPKRKQ
jgi:GT2 family glycosyltransferase